MFDHIMRLSEEPFSKISSQLQDIESRIYDEKRKRVQMGDVIQFRLRGNEEKFINARVIGLLVFTCFEDLFSSFSPSRFGGESIPSLLSVRKYYSRIEEARNGVVGMVLDVFEIKN
ncbi:MAG: hypothetical protein LiPW41_643 [Parcubacteria group bacterium LiPW_41]|nr:MAG: hypothetical protein LiPW41_643 [Parcubacteria group bacterium LiPW_41]